MNVFELIKEKLKETKTRYYLTIANTGDTTLDLAYQKVAGALEEAKTIVDEVAQEYNNGWIPCSERLPKCENGCETQALLFQLKETDTIWCGYYGVGGKFRDNYFRPYTNSTDGFDARDVIAWQPLPAPYKEGGMQ